MDSKYGYVMIIGEVGSDMRAPCTYQSIIMHADLACPLHVCYLHLVAASCPTPACAQNGLDTMCNLHVLVVLTFSFHQLMQN